MGCAADDAFSEGGVIADFPQEGSDSAAIGGITWSKGEFCETFTIYFITAEGAPATTPPETSAFYLADLPVIRVEVEAQETVITDQLVETALVDRLYVVNAITGGMFVDIHLAAPAQAQLLVSESPAALTLSLQNGIVGYRRRPAVDDVIVLIEPVDGSTGQGPQTVKGYARTSNATVEAIATTQGEVVGQRQTTTAPSTNTWGQFLTRLELPPGSYSLFIGEELEEGGFEGLTVDIAIE